MNAIWKAVLSFAVVTLVAAQAPADGHQEQRFKIDRLLDAVRANDEALFATLIGGLETDEPPDAYNGPQLGDYAAEPNYYGALTLAALRRFATACTYAGPNPEVPADPSVFSGFFTCNGEAGHSLTAGFSLDGRRVSAITIMSPADHRALGEQGERLRAEDAVAEAERRAEVAAVTAVVDQLFAAALAGDEARFNALLGRGYQGRGATLVDDRGAAPQGGTLTIAALRPIATDCRRDQGEEPYQYFDMSGEIEQEARFICNGVAGHVLTAGFERNGTRVGWLRLEGQVRRPLP